MTVATTIEKALGALAMALVLTGCPPSPGNDAGDVPEPDAPAANDASVDPDASGMDASSVNDSSAEDSTAGSDAGSDAPTTPLPRVRFMHLILGMPSIAIDVCMEREGSPPPTQPLYASLGDPSGLRYQELGRFVAVEPGVYTRHVVRAGAGCEMSARINSLLPQRINVAERPISTTALIFEGGVLANGINGSDSSSAGTDRVYFNDKLVDTGRTPVARTYRYQPTGMGVVEFSSSRRVDMLTPGTSGTIVVEAMGSPVISRAFRTIDGGAVSLILSGPSDDPTRWRLIVCDELAPPDRIRTHCGDDVRAP